MRKYVSILGGLFVAAVIAGCGGGSNTATTLPGNVPASNFSASDIANKTFTNVAGTTFTFGNSTVTWGTHSGTWQITSGSNLVLTDSSARSEEHTSELQ